MGKEIKPFDMKAKPKRHSIFWFSIIWILSIPFVIRGRVKFKKTNFKSFKEPSLILSNHGSFIDMCNAALIAFPHRFSWVTSIEEFIGLEYIFRSIGMIPKRKFTTDLLMVKKIADVIRNKKKSVCMYPEARFTFAGVTEAMPDSLGKLAKLCKCRVIVINQKGFYLYSPQWNKHPYRHNKIICEATEVFTKDEATNLSADILQKRIEEAFKYNEYQYVLDYDIRFKEKDRADNIHRILYKCPNCHKENVMQASGIQIHCQACNKTYTFDEHYQMQDENGNRPFRLVSDWYNWEREEAIKEVNSGNYHFESDCRIEKLVNAKIGFEKIGIIHLTHDLNGYVLDGTLDDGSHFHLEKSPLSTSSMHIDFNYKKKGACFDIATLDETWFVYPLEKCDIVKFNFTTEAIFAYHEKLKRS